MGAAEFLAGLVFLALVLGCATACGWVLTGRLLAGVAGAPRVLAFGLLAIAALMAAHMLPGLLGIMSREAVAVTAVALLAASALVSARGPAKRPDVATVEEAPAPSGPEGQLSWLLVAGALLLVTASVLAYWEAERASAPSHIDALSFHLPTVARWIQRGSLWHAEDLVPLWAFGYYPQNGNLLQLAVTLPFDNDVFVRWVNIPVLALAGLAVYAGGRELGAPRTSSALAAAAFVAIPVVMRPAVTDTLTDAPLLASFGIGGLFLLRYERRRRRGELVVAGLALGVAFGAKWYGLTTVAIALALWAAATVRASDPLRGAAARIAGVIGLVGLGGGFWLIRNVVESGNPLFPQDVSVAGLTIFDAPADSMPARLGYSIAHYLGDLDVMTDAVLPDLADVLRAPGLLLLAGAVLAGFLVVTRGAPSDGRRVKLLLLATALLALAYIVTPTSALGPEGQPTLVRAASRYLMPALMPAAVTTAWAIGNVGRLRPLLEVAVVAAVIDGLIVTFTNPVGPVVLFTGCLAAAAATGVWLWRRRDDPRSLLGGRPAWVAAAALVVALGLVLVWRTEDAYNASRYRHGDSVLAYVSSKATEGHRIGVAGRWSFGGVSPQYPLFGPRLGNDVEFVGPYRDSLLVNYGSGRAFADAIRRYELLVLGTAVGREERWATAAGWTPLVNSNRFVLMRR